jgi:hypothetical protein
MFNSLNEWLDSLVNVADVSYEMANRLTSDSEEQKDLITHLQQSIKSISDDSKKIRKSINKFNSLSGVSKSEPN